MLPSMIILTAPDHGQRYQKPFAGSNGIPEPVRNLYVKPDLRKEPKNNVLQLIGIETDSFV